MPQKTKTSCCNRQHAEGLPCHTPRTNQLRNGVAAGAALADFFITAQQVMGPVAGWQAKTG